MDIWEMRRSFGEEGGEVLVTGGEVGQDEVFGASLGGILCGLSGGEVVVLAGEIGMGFEIGRFAEEEVGVMGDFEDGLAREGVGDIGKGAARIEVADVA